MTGLRYYLGSLKGCRLGASDVTKSVECGVEGVALTSPHPAATQIVRIAGASSPRGTHDAMAAPRLSQNTLKSMPSLVAIVPFEEQRVQHFWSTAVADPFARLLLSIGSNVSPHAKGYVQRQRRTAADVQRCLRLSFHRTLRFGWLARTRYDALLFTGAKSRLGKVQCEPPEVGISFRRHAGPAVR
jgi:hypothetical protein